MSVITKCLYETAYVPNSETTAYSSTGLKTILDKFSSNANQVATVTIKLVPSGGSAGGSNIIAIKTFAANESYTWPELVGHTLEAGDFVSIVSTVASAVTLRISGRTVS